MIAVIVVVVVVAAIAISRDLSRKADEPPPVEQPLDNTAAKAALPRLLELGSDKCIPCKMMAPILNKLRKDYDGKLVVEFIDVWKNPAVGKRYGVLAIPTQILFDAKGNEISRHTGFFPREHILRTFREAGINLDEPAR